MAGGMLHRDAGWDPHWKVDHIPGGKQRRQPAPTRSLASQIDLAVVDGLDILNAMLMLAGGCQHGGERWGC